MNTSEIRAELSVRMLDLEKAIDLGLPYTELKKIYLDIKELQLQNVLAYVHKQQVITQTGDLIIE